LGEFAATLAHEVKQPLAAIAANCDAAVRWLAAEPPNLDRVRQALTRMIRDWTRANDVIARTSAFAMRGDHEFSDVDLNDAIGEIVRMTAEERRKAGVQMAETLLVDLPPVRGARIELQQVILNLFMNGIEAMQAVCGRQRVLSVRTEIKPPGLIRVSVQDTGSGFDAATAERLFETFFTTKAGGTGLGLRISRSIVEAHGGHLWASQAEPQGALFQFELPTAERAAKDREHG
jgi:signal transduction histidine kinase